MRSNNRGGTRTRGLPAHEVVEGHDGTGSVRLVRRRVGPISVIPWVAVPAVAMYKSQQSRRVRLAQVPVPTLQCQPHAYTLGVSTSSIHSHSSPSLRMSQNPEWWLPYLCRSQPGSP